MLIPAVRIDSLVTRCQLSGMVWCGVVWCGVVWCGVVWYGTGLGSSTVDQVLKYTKYYKYIPSTSTGQVLIILKST